MYKKSISVITPVYNAEKYITDSVKSAVHLIEVGEIILIEDGSQDSSLEVCKELAKEFEKVNLLTHPDNENRGAGASRNLGLENAQFELIAFLDADDYFLPNRFQKALTLFKNDTNIDGVYDAVGTIYQSAESKEIFEKKYSSYPKSEKWGVITTIFQADKNLFSSLLKGDNGHFCTDGIIFKKKLLGKVGPFDLDLKLGQDSLFYFKLSYYGNIVAGNLREPVAIRRIHATNRIIKSSNKNFYRNLFEQKLFKWVISEVKNKTYYTQAVRRYIFHYNGIPNNKVYINKIILLSRIIKTVIKYPSVIFNLKNLKQHNT